MSLSEVCVVGVFDFIHSHSARWDLILMLEFLLVRNDLYFPNSWSRRSHLSASNHFSTCVEVCVLLSKALGVRESWATDQFLDAVFLDFATGKTKTTTPSLCLPPEFG